MGQISKIWAWAGLALDSNSNLRPWPLKATLTAKSSKPQAAACEDGAQERLFQSSKEALTRSSDDEAGRRKLPPGPSNVIPFGYILVFVGIFILQSIQVLLWSPYQNYLGRSRWALEN